jgi:hypothetical protein
MPKNVPERARLRQISQPPQRNVRGDPIVCRGDGMTNARNLRAPIQTVFQADDVDAMKRQGRP